MWPLLLFTTVIFAVPIAAQQALPEPPARAADPCKNHQHTFKEQQDCRTQHAQQFVERNGNLAFPEPFIPVVNPADYLPSHQR